MLEDARIPLLDAGVIFSRPDPNEQGVIYVTDKMPDDMQGFSALHEQLCQNENVAPCSQVESSVLDIMTATDRVRYLSLCLPMFVAVCKLYPDNKSLAATRDMLGRLHQK